MVILREMEHSIYDPVVISESFDSLSRGALEMLDIIESLHINFSSMCVAHEKKKNSSMISKQMHVINFKILVHESLHVLIILILR